MTKVRFPIRLKIFGIAICLLLFMAVVAFLSNYRVSRVHDEVVDIADYHIPLTNLTFELQTIVQGQEVVFQKLLGLRRDVKGFAAFMSELLKTFESSDVVVDQHIKKVLQLVNEGYKNAKLEKDRLEFVKIKPWFEFLEREHQDFHDFSLDVAVLIQNDQREKAGMLIGNIEAKRRQIGERLDLILKELERFTERSSLEASRQEQDTIFWNTIFTVASTMFGLLFAGLLAAGLARPIKRLVHGTAQVEKGDFEHPVEVTSKDEIGFLTNAFNHMVEGLRVRDRIKETFGKYIDPRIVEQLIDKDVSEEKHEMTVSFCDLEGFTNISEQLTPTNVVNLLNNYFTQMGLAISEYQGVIDKYIGDAVMAFWGPPFTKKEDHAVGACRAALQQVSNMEKLRSELPEIIGIRKGLPRLNARIGICTGELVLGNIGSDVLKSYTVIGDTVNLASRLEGINKVYGTSIIISDTVKHSLNDEMVTRKLDRISVKGKEEAVDIYELACLKDQLDREKQDFLASFEEAINYYQSLDFENAKKIFEECLKKKPDDKPSRLFVERMNIFLNEPPPEDWDGVWRFQQK